MGASWYEFDVFFGIIFPRENLRSVLVAIGKKEIVLGKYKCYLVETTIHSRTEHENEEFLLQRCEGFIGCKFSKLLADDVHGLIVDFKDFLKKHTRILSMCGVGDCEPCLVGGIVNKPLDFYEYRDIEEGSDDSYETESDYDDEEEED